METVYNSKNTLTIGAVSFTEVSAPTVVGSTALYGTLAGSNTVAASTVSATSLVGTHYGVLAGSNTVAASTVSATSIVGTHYGALAGSNTVSATSGTFSGNVGIGTMSPANALQVAGTAATISVGGMASWSNVVQLGNVSYSQYGSVSAYPANRFTILTSGLPGVNDMSNGNGGLYVASQGLRLTGQRLVWAATSYESAIEIDGGRSPLAAISHGQIRFYTANAQRAVIDESGNVGIGTASPAYKLDVNGSARIQGDCYVSTSNAMTLYANTFTFRIADTASGAIGTPKVIINSNGPNAGSPQTLVMGVNGAAFGQTAYLDTETGGVSATTPLAFRVNGSEKMRVHTNGNVGIGTTNPGYKLETSGGAIAVTGTNNYLYYAVTNSTASGAYMMFDAQTAGGSGRKYQIGTTGTGNNPGTGCFELYDATGSATRLVVNASGNVGIGTTNPGTTLDVVGSLRSSGAVVFSQSANSPTCVIGASSGGNNSQTGILQVVGRASAYLAIGTSMDATTGQTHIQFNNPNGVVGSIVTNGTATAYNTGSDYRLKSNIVPMTDGLEVINKLDPVYFTFNNDPSEVCSGFIAHVLQEVVPNAVSGEKDAVNDDGTNKYQGVDSSFIVSFLVSAVQELSAKNTDLESKLQTAQNDIDLLESRLAAIEALIGTNPSANTGTTSSGTRADALISQV